MDSVMTATATTTVDGEGPYECEVEVTEQVEMVRSMLASKPDVHWKHTDSHGHFHAFAQGGELPTLRKEFEHVPCDGSCEPPCEGYDRPYYECLICGERVEPGYVPDYEAQTVGIPTKGAKSATVTIHTRQPLPEKTVSLHITHQDGEMIGIGDLRMVEWNSEGEGKAQVFARFLEPRMTS
jgi:hypothetical protein